MRVHILKRLLRAFGVVAGSVAFVGIQGCQSSNAIEAAPVAQPPKEVAIATPSKQDVYRLIELPVDIQPAQEAVLFAKTAGYLQQLLVDRGDSVKAGQLLAVIQAPELQAESAQALATQGASQEIERRSQSSVSQSEAERRMAVSAVDEAKSNLTGALEALQVAINDRARARASLESSRSDVEAAQAELSAATAQKTLADTTYNRYKQIYDRDPQLIARQDVDTAQANAEVVVGKLNSAKSKVLSAKQNVIQAEAQLRSTENRINQANAQISVARARVNGANADVNVRAAKVEVSRRDAAVAKSQTRAFSSAVQKSLAMSAYTRIVAPFDGTITRRFVDVGAFIQAATTNTNAASIVTISDLRSLRAYVNIPESEASFVHKGTEIRIAFSPKDKSPLNGIVARTSGALDPKTRTMLAEVDLDNSAGHILAGSYALGKVVLETHPNTLSLPAKAIGSDKSGKFVWMVEDGKAKRIAVTVGFNDGKYAEILEGLKGEELVVADKLDQITPGVAVKEGK